MIHNQSSVVKDEDDELKYLILTDFEHFDEVNKLIDELNDIIGNQNREEKWEDRLKYIFDQYQDQPHLLDPYLEKLLKKCIILIGKPKVIERRESFVFRLIYLMVKTRGYKTIIRLMPHEVSDLEPVLSMLSDIGEDSNENWQARYVLILWLSIVIHIPFDMQLFDVEKKQPITERIIEIGKRFLHCKDVSQIASSFMLAKFVCRPDSIEHNLLDIIIKWAIHQIETVDMGTIIGHNFMCGLLRFFTYLFKFGKREDLLPYSRLVLKINNNIDTVKWDREILLCRLRTKLVQRIGLIFLKIKVFSWRYERGNRILLNNIGVNVSSGGGEIHGPTSNVNDGTTNVTGCAIKATGETIQDCNDADDDDDFEVSEHLDEVVDFLINSLKNYFTTVRWSAAKGLGRICSRLPKTLADDVVEAILVLFSRLEGFSAWHGGCLALAELGRRGLLLPSRLCEVLPLIYTALVYDEKSGECSYGSNVRDAACYVVWSFARAYQPQELAPHVLNIAGALLMVTLFDREVNVRRAASAAFQENVGRQGQFPHGIDILTNCDYFAVGNLHNCFLQLSVYVASFDEYIRPMIDHLVKLKVGHWDYDIRELTSRALHLLYGYAPDYILNEVVLKNLLAACTGLDLYRRQGAILSIAEIIRALPAERVAELAEPSSPYHKLYCGVADLTEQLDTRMLFRGLSGELMRRAVCHLIHCVAIANIDYYSHPVIDKWYKFLVECTTHKEKLVRTASIEAFPKFLERYSIDKTGQLKQEFIQGYIDDFIHQIVDTGTEYIQIAALSILGKTPRHILLSDYIAAEPSDSSSQLQQQPPLTTNYKSNLIFVCALDTLMQACQNDIVKSCKWGEARSYAVVAVVDIIETLGADCSDLTDDFLRRVYTMLLISLDDYTFDSHGDIGALLRESAMRQLLRLTQLIVSHSTNTAMSTDTLAHRLLICNDEASSISHELMSKIAQQAMEKIDRVRKVAGSVFYSLMTLQPQLLQIPHLQQLKQIFTEDICRDLYWAAPQNTFPLFCQLLQFPEYIYRALLGLCISVGGMTEKTVQHSREAFHNVIKHKATGCDVEFLVQLSQNLLSIFHNYQHQDRVICPLLKSVDFLFNDPNFSGFIGEPQNNSILQQFIECTKSEISTSKDVQKIKSGIEVYCTMLQFTEEIWMKALSCLMILLGHRFPVIRKHTASYLYQSLLMYDIIDEEKMDQVMSILQDTVWDKDLKEVREIRNSMCDLFGISSPKLVVNGN